jgi:hypothetical protein
MERKKAILAIAIIMIVMVAIFIGYASYKLMKVARVEESQSYEYQLHITGDNNHNYTVYVPVLIDETGSTLEIAQDLEITNGSATYEIIETEYGTALKVESNQDVSIELMGDRIIPGPRLSLFNGSLEEQSVAYGSVEFWIFCDKPTGSDFIVIDISLAVEISKETYNGFDAKTESSYKQWAEQIRDVRVTNGWQTVEGLISIETED